MFWLSNTILMSFDVPNFLWCYCRCIVYLCTFVVVICLFIYLFIISFFKYVSILTSFPFFCKLVITFITFLQVFLWVSLIQFTSSLLRGNITYIQMNQICPFLDPVATTVGDTVLVTDIDVMLVTCDGHFRWLQLDNIIHFEPVTTFSLSCIYTRLVPKASSLRPKYGGSI